MFHQRILQRPHSSPASFRLPGRPPAPLAHRQITKPTPSDARVHFEMVHAGSHSVACRASSNCSTPRNPDSMSVQTRTRASEEPSDNVLSIWRRVDAVCFDVDFTLTKDGSLDLLAEFMGVKCRDEMDAMTAQQASDGSLDQQGALDERLRIIDCTPSDIQAFLEAHPPESRLAPNAKKCINALQARGISVYLISGGFREVILPLAEYLGVPKDNVLANRMTWQWDDATGAPTRLVGFDASEPTAHNMPKVQAVERIREQNPYNTVVMVGDGITDLEAAAASGAADLFIGYGGVIEREAVASAAEWYIYDHMTLLEAFGRLKVAVLGSGAWACAATRMIAQNVVDPATKGVFDPCVKMWVRQADQQGLMLTDVINDTHVHHKYLPGIHLGENVVADPDLVAIAREADVIVICVPHQYVHGICKQISGKVKKDAVAISLIKGMRVMPEGPQLISVMVQRMLRIDCSVLMGGNIARDIADEQMSEAVIGYTQRSNALLLQSLFVRPYFKVNILNDTVGAEMCGTLKNIVAIAAGMVDGQEFGPNTKAAIIRQGFLEMRLLAKALYSTVRDETFFDCCGVTDLLATCYGGRNRLVAEEWARRMKAGNPTSFEKLEAEMLGGQKLQGVLTSNEVQEILKLKGWEKQYPLFTTVNRIIHSKFGPEFVVRYEAGANMSFPEAPKHDESIFPTRILAKTLPKPALKNTPAVV